MKGQGCNRKTLVGALVVVLQGCSLALLNPGDDEDRLPLDIPSGHSRVLVLGSEFTFSTQVALCFGPTCEAKDQPLASATVDNDIVELRATPESGAAYVPGSSELLVVFSREQGDAKLTVSGEVEDGTQVTRDINLFVRQPDLFEVDAICDRFVDDDLAFLEGVSVDVRPLFRFDDRVMEGEHPQALIADNLMPRPSVQGVFTLMPPVGSKSVSFSSPLVPDQTVRARVFSANELRITNMHVTEDLLNKPRDIVVLSADAEVDGKRACTTQGLDATVLTPTVCGDKPTVTFSSGLFADIKVLQTGRCELQFTDATGVHTFAFDARIEAQ